VGEIKLDDICEAIVDCEHKTAPLTAFGYPSVRTTNIKNGRIDWDNCNRVDQATYDAWTRRREPKPGDLILAREAPVGEVGLIPEEHKAVLGQRTVLICPDRSKVDPRYLHFLLISPDVQADMLGKATGSTVEHLNMSDIRELPLPELPPLPEQRSIARVLGGLDDKIELNRRMNRTLEDLARGVFRSWFVDFDPVTKPSRGFAGNGHGRAPATPAGLFPKRLVDSPIGPIPEGWRVGTVGDIGTNPRRGVLPSEVDSATPYIGLEHMPRRCIALDDWGTAADVSSGKSRFARGEILFGKLRPYFHKVGVALIDGVCSTDVIVAAPKKECWFGVLLGHLSSDEFIDYVDGASGGTRMPRTSWGDMARYQIAIPPEPIAASFAVWMRRVSELMREHAHESRTLAALRDALLPQLLSGEIRLRDAEAAVGDSIHAVGTPRRGDGSTHLRTGKVAGRARGKA
jgi:type I restriction enzyme S subunit